MKKGFTLIELLAVIVILAIIALIATPIILNIISDARKSSNERSAELYVSAVEQAIARKNLTSSIESDSITCEISTQSPYQVTCNGVEVEVDVSKMATGGTLVFTNGKLTSVSNLHIQDQYCSTDSNNKISCSSEEGEEQETLFTGTIYRNSTETVNIGQSIAASSVWCIEVPEMGNTCDFGYYLGTEEDCLDDIVNNDTPEGAICKPGTLPGLTSYETEETKSNITQSYYLKHEVVNNIVEKSHACAKFGGQEYCVEGGNADYYGWVTDETDSTGNVEKLYDIQSLEISGVRCYFSSGYSFCRAGSVDLYADSNGLVNAYDGDGHCDVPGDGGSYCGGG